MSYKYLLKQAKEDPVTTAISCQTEVEKLEGGYQKSLHSLLAAAYAVAHELARDYREWVEFTKLDFWKHRRKRLKPQTGAKRVLLHVMVFVFKG